MEIQLVLENRYGKFIGRKVEVTEEHYTELLKMVKSFYNNGGFELTLEDGSFVVFPPNIVQESILKVEKR